MYPCRSCRGYYHILRGESFVEVLRTHLKSCCNIIVLSNSEPRLDPVLKALLGPLVSSADHWTGSTDIETIIRPSTSNSIETQYWNPGLVAVLVLITVSHSKRLSTHYWPSWFIIHSWPVLSMHYRPLLSIVDHFWLIAHHYPWVSTKRSLHLLGQLDEILVIQWWTELGDLIRTLS